MSDIDRYAKAIEALRDAYEYRERYKRALGEAAKHLTAYDLKGYSGGGDIEDAFALLISKGKVDIQAAAHVKASLCVAVSEGRQESISLHEPVDQLGGKALKRIIDEVGVTNIMAR